MADRPRDPAPDADLNSDPDASQIAELEAALADLGRHLAYPPTPDFSATVSARIAAGPARQRFWSRLVAPRSLAWAALVLVLLAGGLLFAWPDARRAVAERLGLPGVDISYLPVGTPVVTPASAPPDPSPGRAPTSLPMTPVSPSSAEVGDRLGLGERLPSVAAAQARVAYTVLAPTLPDLGPPDEVHLGARPTGGQVALVYRARPGLPESAETGVGLLFTQFRGSLDPNVLRKALLQDSRLEQVAVNGRSAFWIEGPPHQFYFRDQSGGQGEERFRLAGNVLLWVQDGLTLRIEGTLTRDQALRIAESVR